MSFCIGSDGKHGIDAAAQPTRRLQCRADLRLGRVVLLDFITVDTQVAVSVVRRLIRPFGIVLGVFVVLFAGRMVRGVRRQHHQPH